MYVCIGVELYTDEILILSRKEFKRLINVLKKDRHKKGEKENTEQGMRRDHIL